MGCASLSPLPGPPYQPVGLTASTLEPGGKCEGIDHPAPSMPAVEPLRSLSADNADATLEKKAPLIADVPKRVATFRMLTILHTVAVGDSGGLGPGMQVLYTASRKATETG
eukprot:TRINITY_DN16709_c0_g1_i2.p1 TRINITY_DN16709_c0_g1~~TRINITY_DN16709_c0_g1_i2.p1  ORF type:complete len:125 (-),score=2.59 TRINITY_DN16709_c0_g1_i2:164-496(-)